MKSFENIIGYENVKNELYQVIDIFKNKELYKGIGAELPKGILITGDPGLGKTMLANATINECGVKSYLLTKNKGNDDILDQITSTFDEASKDEASIILIDDIDKFSEESETNVDAAAFIAIQAGIDSVRDKNVLVIATANNYRKLPKSLLRAGRFDRKLSLLLPSQEDAQKIIEYYMKNKYASPNLNYEDVSKMISYASCASLKTIINESAIHAAFKRKKFIDTDDVVAVVLKNQYETTVDSLKCDEEQLEMAAYHEAGHAVIASVLKEGSVGMVSIATSNRNNKGGFTHLCSELVRRPENILVALGGKAASELYLSGRCASGCQDDLSRALNLIRQGIDFNGTSGLGLLDASSGENPISSVSLARNEDVVRAELEHYMFIARDILIKNKDFFFKLEKELKEKYTLLYSDIKKIRESTEITRIYLP